ncbi:hypothetical protein [Deinococcus rubellus]|uniref:Uncharacterized protein n=1 Tax=Deinococcus rubellus TaxID=1889240 RepID=A0ABY5YHH9_9DEIO|nr:hypothetical protein [Deinococcus rubellus]UWX63847.1 hypothetical protein N0D28_14135 [Deinococcus rubellus]
MNLLSAVRSVLNRLLVRPARPGNEPGGDFAGVTAPHGPRPRQGGAHAPLPEVEEELSLRR